MKCEMHAPFHCGLIPCISFWALVTVVPVAFLLPSRGGILPARRAATVRLHRRPKYPP